MVLLASLGVWFICVGCCVGWIECLSGCSEESGVCVPACSRWPLCVWLVVGTRDGRGFGLRGLKIIFGL